MWDAPIAIIDTLAPQAGWDKVDNWIEETATLSDKPYKGRREDYRLLTGRGKYTADHDIAGQAFAYFLRADRAHAKIVRIDTAAARKGDGVLGVLTGADIIAAGWKSPAAMAFFKGIGGSTLRDPFRPALAHERVRFVGEPVALVIAESEYQAQDAAELIEVEYEDLPVIVEASDAGSDQAVALHDGVPNNLALDYVYGDQEKTERAFSEAAHVVRVDLRAQRIAGNPMEPKSCVARYDAAADTFEICVPSQGTSDFKSALAQITGLDRSRFIIHSIDVGGGFGIRNEIYPEFPALMLAAKQTGRPVKWTGTRSETISGDHHARAADLTGELALDATGRILGLRVQWLVNLGAYCSGAGASHQHRGGADLVGDQPVQRARGLRPAPADVHQHDADDRVPRRRPSERLVSVGASGRRGGEEARHRFDQAAPAQSSQDQPVSAQDTDRLDLRQRRSGGTAGHAPWTRRSGSLSRSARRAAKKAGRLRGIGLALFLEPSGGVGREEIKIEINPMESLRCTRLPARRDRGTKPCFPTWSRKSWVCPTIASSCDTTTTRCRNWPGPAASDRAR